MAKKKSEDEEGKETQVTVSAAYLAALKIVLLKAKVFALMPDNEVAKTDLIRAIFNVVKE
jgi:hypothetical protein